VVKDKRLLPAARTNDDLPSADFEELFSLKGTEQIALIKSKNGRVAPDLHARLLAQLGLTDREFGRLTASVLEVASETRFALQEVDNGPGAGRFRSRGHPGRSTTDDTHLGLYMRDVRFAPWDVLDIDASQAGDVADHVLEYRPEPARFVEALVVKPDRQ
jgi:hypothetical protein